MNFRIFKQVPRLIFGKKSINRINELLPDKIDNDYFVYVIDDFFENNQLIKNINIDEFDHLIFFPATKKEPSTDQIDLYRDNILQKYNHKLPKAIIGLGGGSTMDVTKSISVMLCNPGSSKKYQG